MAIRASNRPWISAKTWAVPWQARHYCFDHEKGHPGILDEQWYIDRNPHTGRVEGYTPKAQTRLNPRGFFEMNMDEVERNYREAEMTGESLRIVAGKMFGSRMTASQIEALAFSPDVYASVTDEERKVTDEDREAKVKAFKEKIAPPSRKRATPVEA